MSGVDQYDIEEDVTRLKKVWNDIKEPKVKMPKRVDSTQNATQTRISKNDTSKLNQKGTRVVVSESHLKNTVRNPKPDPEKVIEVKTKPQKARDGTVAREGMTSAPEHLILTAPEGCGVKEGEDLRRTLAQREHEISLLRVSNSRNEDRVMRLEGLLQQKEAVIQELRARERELTQRIAQLDSADFNFTYGKVEYQNYRHDSRRLLKLLKSTQQYSQFAELALDDGGVRYLSGLEGVKTRLDAPSGKKKFHFCTCNKDFIPEALVWVPEKAYQFGKQFIKQRKGQLKGSQLDLLLYQLNKIWREREKRIVNHINALKANQIGKYKRRLQTGPIIQKE